MSASATVGRVLVAGGTHGNEWVGAKMAARPEFAPAAEFRSRSAVGQSAGGRTGRALPGPGPESQLRRPEAPARLALGGFARARNLGRVRPRGQNPGGR